MLVPTPLPLHPPFAPSEGEAVETFRLLWRGRSKISSEEGGWAEGSWEGGWRGGAAWTSTWLKDCVNNPTKKNSPDYHNKKQHLWQVPCNHDIQVSMYSPISGHEHIGQWFNFSTIDALTYMFSVEHWAFPAFFSVDRLGIFQMNVCVWKASREIQTA